MTYTEKEVDELVASLVMTSAAHRNAREERDKALALLKKIHDEEWLAGTEVGDEVQALLKQYWHF